MILRPLEFPGDMTDALLESHLESISSHGIIGLATAAHVYLVIQRARKMPYLPNNF